MFSRWFKTADRRPPTTDPPPAIRHSPSAIRCPLCGKQFTASEAAQCPTCALAKKCGLVMCPRCHYEFAA
ncbi:MAG: hypothetical protein HY868_00855 [Chloroflexi bacterium]|nr:hypothetical protein [Chloroflexota bacterium]